MATRRGDAGAMENHILADLRLNLVGLRDREHRLRTYNNIGLYFLCSVNMRMPVIANPEAGLYTLFARICATN